MRALGKGNTNSGVPMADITFSKTAFSQDAALFAAQGLALVDLLTRRRLSVAQNGTEVCHTYVTGEDQKTAVEAARKLGAKRVMVIAPAAVWSVTDEMGGRMVRVALPQSGSAPLRDAALMLLADLLAEPFGAMVAADVATGALIDMARRVARFDVSVFINGPTGSGKEVLSRLIHTASARADKPFVAINCAAIPENMLEAILFGHEKGAFTGAATANKGILRAADGGTLLLDEISEMPLGLQAKLLRVLQEKVVTPLGSQSETPVDVRILATSNRDMEAEIARGAFREDLYYRLNVFPLETLPLAARPEDIPVLAQAMLRRHSCAGAVPLLSAEACELLCQHGWPGNVRELENVMQRALVLAESGTITASDIMLVARANALPSPHQIKATSAPLAARAA